MAAALAVLVLAGCSTTVSGQGRTPGQPGPSGGDGSVQLTTLWKQNLTTGDGDGQLEGGSSDGSRFYVGSIAGDVWALNVKTGAVQWHTHGGDRTPAGVGVVGGVVWQYDTDKGIIAIDPATGQVLWRHADTAAATGDVYLPAWSKGVVAVSTLDGLLGLDAPTGHQRWGLSNEKFDVSNSAVVTDGTYFYAIGTVIGSAVPATELVAIVPSTGRIAWSVPVSQDDEDDTLYAAPGVILTFSDGTQETPTTVTAYDTKSHAKRWTSTVQGISPDIETPARDGTTLVFTTLQGLRGISTATGATLFTTKLDEPPDTVGTCAGHACSLGLSTISVLDPAGKVIAQHAAPGPADEPSYPVLLGHGLTFFYDGGGTAYRLG